MSNFTYDDIYELVDIDTDLLKEIANVCKEEFIKAVQVSVYDYWRTPDVYDRKKRLVNPDYIKTDIQGNMIRVYYHGSFGYSSNESNFDLFLLNYIVPFWVDQGHHSNKYGSSDDNYFHYTGRNFTGTAKANIERRLKSEFGIDSEVSVLSVI